MSKLKMPDFQTEAEEAAWWFENQNVIAAEYAEEHAENLLSLVVDEADLKLALAQANVHGMTPREYVRQLVHVALLEQQAA